MKTNFINSMQRDTETFDSSGGELLPFDLEIALKHPERVTTIGGLKIKQIYLFDSGIPFPLYACDNNGDITSYTKGGGYQSYGKTNLDLFLLPEVKEIWINVYISNDKNEIETIAFNEECLAIRASIDKNSMYTYIKTIHDKIELPK